MKIRKNRTVFRRHFILPMLVAMVFMMSATVYASSESASVQIPVKQIFTVKQGTVQKEGDVFYYQLTSQKAENPMPEESKDGAYSFSLKDTQEETLQEITYHKIGDYEYQMEQTVSEKKEGYGYDQKAYTVVVSIRSREDGGLYADLILKNEAGEKVETASFTNTYTGKKLSGGTGTGGTSPNYTTPSSQSRPLVKTGDETKVFLLLALLAGSAVTLVAVGASKRKNQENA